MTSSAYSASVALKPAQANCLSLGEINSSQLVYYDNSRMHFYLTNTNLNTKRIMVGDTINNMSDNNNISRSASDIYSPNNTGKRKLAETGTWWLPGGSSTGRRPTWPTSGSTLRRRTGWWIGTLDPGWVETLEAEHIKHKILWKKLHLEPTNTVEEDQKKSVDVWRFLGDLEGSQAEHHGVAGDGDLKSSISENYVCIEPVCENVQPVCVQTNQLEMLHTVMVGDEKVELGDGDAQGDPQAGAHAVGGQGDGPQGEPGDPEVLEENEIRNVHTFHPSVHGLYSYVKLTDMKHEDCGPQGELGLEDHQPMGGGDLHGGAQARGGRAEVRLDGDGGVDTEEISEISTISEPVPKRRRCETGPGHGVDAYLDGVPGVEDDHHQHDVAGPGGDAVLGMKEPAKIIPRRGRGRQGVRRDALLQMAISNFTVKTKNFSEEGGSAASMAVQKK